MSRVITVLLIAVLAAGAGLAALSGVANASAPGDALYGLDLAAERVSLAMATAPERAMAVRISIAAERLEEVRALLARGEGARAETALVAFEASLAEMTPDVTGATGNVAEQASQDMDDAFEPAVADEDEPEEYSLYCENGAYITDAPEHKVGLRLATFYEVELAEIMGWYCQGFGFGEIKLAYAAASKTDYTPEDIFLMRGEGLGWGEIWNAIGLIAHPRDDAEDDQEVPGEDQDDRGVCTSERDHPHGQQLATQFGVEYAEVMEWFCKGFGFGEIKLAYSISQKMEVDVTEVFALRESGMGWGEVMHEYGLNGRDLKPDRPNGKPEDKPGGRPEDKPKPKK